MIRKRFNSDYDEVDRTSRVKLHKSGKSWVRTLLSQLSLFRVMGKGNAKSQVTESVTITSPETADELTPSSRRYLKAILAAGALTGGGG